MPTPTEQKIVQGRSLEYAQEIGWTFVLRLEAARRRTKLRLKNWNFRH